MTNNFRIKTLDNKSYNMREMGVVTRNFTINSPQLKIEQEEIDGQDGSVDVDTVYEGRTMNAECMMIAKDSVDFPLLRNELYKILASKEPFYLTVDNEPKKQWLVKTEGFTIDRTIINHWGEFTIDFISSSPYAKSVGTTLDDRTFDAEFWQVGQGLKAEDLSYAYSVNNFQIYNAGDALINPRQMELRVKYQGASNDLTITNNTTGDEWSYAGTSGSNDTITLDGIRSIKNGLSIFKDTNKNLITIDKGFNDFSVTGTEGSFLISFDFKFYYI